LTVEATLARGDSTTDEQATESASGRYYDEDADEMVAVEIEMDGELTADVGPTGAERVTVVAYPADIDAEALSSVTVDGKSLERVEADPEVGEWTVREDGAVVARR
jgi:ABC-type enterochelin transport system ATPase subunit